MLGGRGVAGEGGDQLQTGEALTGNQSINGQSINQEEALTADDRREVMLKRARRVGLCGPSTGAGSERGVVGGGDRSGGGSCGGGSCGGGSCGGAAGGGSGAATNEVMGALMRSFASSMTTVDGAVDETDEPDETAEADGTRSKPLLAMQRARRMRQALESKGQTVASSVHHDSMRRRGQQPEGQANNEGKDAIDVDRDDVPTGGDFSADATGRYGRNGRNDFSLDDAFALGARHWP